MIHRLSRLLFAAGLLLLAMTAVAFAQDPTPTPTATPEPAVTVTATPTAIATLAATPEAVLTASPTATATETATATPTATATTETPELVATRPQVRVPRANPTPPPTATPTPPDQITGAAMTICAYVSDGVYDAVVISADQYSLYFDNENNIIPAPSTGCEDITDPDAARNAHVTVCHLEPNGSYSLHSYPAGVLGGHADDKGDLIPAPGGSCPGLSGYGVPTATATDEPTPAPTSDVEDENEQGGSDPTATATAAPAVAAAVQTGATAGQLPFTGFDLWLIASAGLAMVMMGAGLRLMAGQPPVGVTR